MTPAGPIRVRRLGPGDEILATALFALMAEVFEETGPPPSAAYVRDLLGREDLWVLAATIGDAPAGGLTAHILAMTAREGTEAFIYDLAVHPRHQRRGVGRCLVEDLRRRAAAAGVDTVFVPADNEDVHALDFYRAIGGDAAPVTIFSFESPPA